MKEKLMDKKFWISFGKIVLITLLIEIFIFNYRSVVTLFNKPINAFTDCTIVVDDIRVDENGNMFIDGDNPAICIDDIHEKVSAFQLKVSMPNAIEIPYMESGVMYITVYSRYEDTKAYYLTKNQNIVNGIDRSTYISLYSTRELDSISLDIDMSNGSYFVIEKLVLNPRVPFSFNYFRIVVVAYICIFACLFRKKSSFWKVSVSDKDSTGEWMVLGFLTLLIVATGCIMLSNKGIGLMNPYNSYNMLAEAFVEGQLSLLPEPPGELEMLDNPYDCFERQLMEEGYLFDIAYYDGHYYVYSGVVPCLLYYVPMKALTGLNMPTTLVMEINIILFAVGMFFLLRSLLRKYAPKTSMPLFLLLYMVATCGCQILYFANQPDDYMIPIICAAVFIVWGLYFWNSSIIEEEDYRLSMPRVMLGSLCMALVAGCRPQLLIYSLLAFIIFKQFLKPNTEKKYTGKRMSLTLLGALIPYVVVAISLMWYNYVRFDSPFEFGTKYNLTSYDVSMVRFGMDEIFAGLYGYFMQLPGLYNDFPFITLSPRIEEIMGFTGMYVEGLPGGLLVTNLILLFIFGIRYIREKKEFYNLSLGILIISFLAVALDTEIIGIVYRYMMDFSFGFFVVMACVIAGIEERLLINGSEKSTTLHIFRKVVIWLGVASLVYNFLLLMVFGTKYPLVYGNTNLYYRIFYAIRFWT